MEPVKSAILWASRNPWLKRNVPRLPFVRRALRQFMPGETMDVALATAKSFLDRGLPTTFTHLGENVTSPVEAQGVVDHYLLLLDRIAELGLDSEISVKLTHLGFDLDLEVASSNFQRLVERADELGNWVWIDIESSGYVEGTIQVYRRALVRWQCVGLCLQAYLHRTPSDIESMLELTPSIRLVKGAYREAPSIALQRRSRVSERFVELSRQLLEGVRDGKVRRFAAATHDIELLPRLDAAVGELGLGRDAYEVQMLYGIRQAEQFALAERGLPTRSLIAYGPAWYAWYVRRLAERPANLWFVAKNLFGGSGPGPTRAA